MALLRSVCTAPAGISEVIVDLGRRDGDSQSGERFSLSELQPARSLMSVRQVICPYTVKELAVSGIRFTTDARASQVSISRLVTWTIRSFRWKQRDSAATPENGRDCRSATSLEINDSRVVARAGDSDS
jgi:hypothetical protein